ncbi:PAS domain S-box protein [Thermodesulfobacterium hveragerdense]|uniref:PAS domain S-box protein n=1 Tax=Thermodesulfobacterium hveragerdense TaxID=53424 RepID=UPI00040FFEE7|nr:PAS domain S-box protein [Thermodesulfobacterium hveragerdense]
MEKFLNFAVCNCQKDRSLVWEELVDGIVKKTGLKIELKIFRDLEEELRYLDSFLPDIYFSSFVNSCALVKKGFIPVAKVKGLGHSNFCLISRKDFLEFNHKEKEFLKLGLLKNPCLINLLLVLYQDFPISLNRVLPILFSSQKEIKDSFLKKHIDLALLSADFLKNNQEIFRSNFWLPISYHDIHFFMLNPGSPYFLWLRDFFLNPFTLKGLEVDLVSQEEQFIKTFAILPELLSTLWEKALIYELFYKSSYLGMLIYRDDQVLLANEYALKRLNYEPQDLKDYKMEDLFSEERIKKLVRENIKKRCTGEFFSTVYNEVPVKTKQGRKRWFNVYEDTIVFQGDFGGLSLVIDITSEVRYKKLIEVLKEINHLMIESYSEEELFDKVVKTLVKVLELKGTWIGEIDELTRRVKPILYYPETLSFINRLDPYLFSLENQTLSFYKAFHEKK